MHRCGRRSSTRIRAAGASSRACSRSTRPRAMPTPCSIFSLSGRRCGRWRSSSSNFRCRSRRVVCRGRGGPLARAQAGLIRRRRTSHEETDMDLKLDGKTALVTGGSAGIGKGIARALAREGVDVAICARRKEPLEATAAEIRAESGRRVVAIPADLTRKEDAENFVTGAAKALGRIDILVNNAGSAPGGILEVLDEAAWMQ